MMPSQRWLFERQIKAAQAAAKVLSLHNAVIFDTETTGLSTQTDKIVEIAAINLTGDVLLNLRLDPQMPMPEKAESIHHISDEMLVGQPTFKQAFAQISAALHGKHWIIYNYDFDHELIVSEAWRAFRKNSLISPASDGKKCAMKMFASFYGDYSDYHGSFTWQKLTRAADYFGVEVAAPPHSALGDCLRTLGVLRGMSAWLDQPILKELIAC